MLSIHWLLLLRGQSAIRAGSVATAQPRHKTAKCINLSSSHVFCPVAVETLGALADDALVFLAEIGRRAMLCTADPWETTFLYQRNSMATQRFKGQIPHGPVNTCKLIPAAMFFYVNSDVICMRLHDCSTGGVLLVGLFAVLFVKFHTYDQRWAVVS